MNYALWANATAVVHFFIIVAVVGGLLLSYRYRRFRPWEAALLVSILVIDSYYKNCPLALLEQYLRTQAGQHVNISSVGFTAYYFQKFFSITLAPKLVQQTTFFSGAMFFGASIEWFSPFFHYEIFKLRKTVRKSLSLRKKTRRYRM